MYKCHNIGSYSILLNLVKLSIRACCLDNSICSIIATLPKLKDLYLNDTYGTDNISSLSQSSIEILTLVTMEINSLPFIKTLKKLTLKHCDPQIDLSNIANIRKVLISHTRYPIKDIQMLKNIHNLTISHSQDNDISVLGTGKINTLTLSHCDYIKDISALKNIKSLHIKYCHNLRHINLDNMPNVRELKIKEDIYE